MRYIDEMILKSGSSIIYLAIVSSYRYCTMDNYYKWDIIIFFFICCNVYTMNLTWVSNGHQITIDYWREYYQTHRIHVIYLYVRYMEHRIGYILEWVFFFYKCGGSSSLRYLLYIWLMKWILDFCDFKDSLNLIERKFSILTLL